MYVEDVTEFVLMTNHRLSTCLVKPVWNLHHLEITSTFPVRTWDFAVARYSTSNQKLWEIYKMMAGSF